MAQQLILDLPFRPAMGRNDFFVSEANAAAVAQIDGWRDWPMHKLILVGPEGAGKTHLAHVWAAMSGARILSPDMLHAADPTPQPTILEDADWVAQDAPAEEALFHLHNALAQAQAPLLLTARSAPSRWGIALPDLASRMAQANLVHIGPPDDALLTAVMVKRALDCQVALSPRMLNYLAPRLPRSFAAANAVIAAIDARALAKKRRVPTQAHIRAALAEVTEEPSS